MNDFYEEIESQFDGLKLIQEKLEAADQDESAELIGEAVQKLCKLIPSRIRDVFCPQCKKDFALQFGEIEYGDRDRATLSIYSCPSGGVYRVEICCPHCNYVEPV